MEIKFWLNVALAFFRNSWRVDHSIDVSESIKQPESNIDQENDDTAYVLTCAHIFVDVKDDSSTLKSIWLQIGFEMLAKSSKFILFEKNDDP